MPQFYRRNIAACVTDLFAIVFVFVRACGDTDVTAKHPRVEPLVPGMTGLFQSADDNAITLVDNAAKTHIVERDEIEDIRASSQSLMPAGFDKLGKEQLHPDDKSPIVTLNRWTLSRSWEQYPEQNRNLSDLRQEIATPSRRFIMKPPSMIASPSAGNFRTAHWNAPFLENGFRQPIAPSSTKDRMDFARLGMLHGYAA